ncbi:MAG TPA: STAS domain-containing protein [Leptospiraceae bacterium]|nr:STAS domain-containing protein [Leptospiraceae bacterium]HMY66497.1 STAS domain-containing protein [Leptospiraceae bacterium]HMZ59607.1 STAS domain-containing protein [Leptospiraceae bacterium]HNF12596.1 STAS domain-containing protein [Leptospiraceae bacterium]HNF23773.1 STAS domain-containing protein [Leptospiraceae bacterium]
MELIKREVNSIPIVDIVGEVDLYNTKEIKDLIDQMIKEGKYQIILNLGQVPFMDSSGIGTLVTGMYRLKKYQGNLKIVNIVGSVAKVFKMTGMDAHLEIFETEEDAVKSFK